METNGYIERAIIQSLAKHDSELNQDPPIQSVEGSTVDMHTGVKSIEESVAEASVRRALGRLREKGLIEDFVPERLDSPKRPNYWRLTDAGIIEAGELYATLERETAELKKRYGKRHFLDEQFVSRCE